MYKSILVKLLNVYKEEGYEVSVGLNHLRDSPNGLFAYLVKSPTFKSLSVFPDKDINTYKMYLKKETDVEKKLSEKKLIIKNTFNKIRHLLIGIEKTPSAQPAGESYLYTGAGISLEEIYFFENLLKSFVPDREFFIGIASGWSTIAFGLMTPTAELFGIDNCSEGTKAEEGLILTENIARKLNITLKIYKGSSPDDVPYILNNVKNGINFAFIDGLHTNEQIFLDFKGILPYMADSSIIAFHDVLNWNMLGGWKKIIEEGTKNNYKHAILRRTTSGIGILYRNVNNDVEEIIRAFYQHPSFPCPT